MSNFTHIESNNDIKEVIKSAFDMELSLAGAWGYTKALSTIIEASETPVVHLEHIIASMRAYLEMNMTLPKEERYGSINLNEVKREHIREDNQIYDKVTYKISAMKESDYTAFINEYKENYKKESFDINGHFERRREATLTREVIHWFEVTALSNLA